MSGGEGTLSKSLTALERVAAFGRPVRFAELLAESPYPKATLYRLLQDLVANGLLQRGEGTGEYTLGGRLMRLAHAAWRDVSLAPLAHPYLVALSRKTGEAVHLGQLENGQVLYLDKVSLTFQMQMFSAIGRIGPAYCTGIGKVMLAFLPEVEAERVIALQSFHRFTPHTLDAAGLRSELRDIRAAGLAWDREEHEPGIVCCAAPILTPNGRLLGALSVTSIVQRKGLSGLADYQGDIRDAAIAIGRDASRRHAPDRDRAVE